MTWKSGTQSLQDTIEYSTNGTWVVASSTVLSSFVASNNFTGYTLGITSGSTVTMRVKSNNYGGDSDYATSDSILIAG